MVDVVISDKYVSLKESVLCQQIVCPRSSYLRKVQNKSNKFNDLQLVN